jgi:Gas vesicle synthesis protein GvpL/GvpF
VIDLYAVTDDPAPPLPAVAPLHAVTSHGLAVVCAPSVEGHVSAETLWRHEEVVEALLEDRDLLPVRYGTRVDDDAAAVRVLDQRHDELLKALDRVRGAVELSVRVQSDPANDEARAPATSGAAYLRTRASSTAARESAERALHEPLSRLARSGVRRAPRSPREVLRAAYLVERDRVEAFTDEVARLQDANPDLRLLCTGPWPPYSFADQ